MPSKVIIDIGARVASIEGADKAAELVQKSFDEMMIRPQFDIDGKQLQAQLTNVVEMFKINKKAGVMDKFLSTQTSYGDKVYKNLFKFREDAEGLGGDIVPIWDNLTVSISDASKEIDIFYKKSQQLISQISKTGGKPTEMAYLNKELASTISKMEEFAKVSASVSPKGFMNVDKVAGMTKSLAVQYKVAMDNVNMVTEKNLETSIGKVSNAYKKMYENITPIQSSLKYWVKESGVTKSSLKKKEAAFRESGKATVKAEKEYWQLLLKNGAISA